MRSQLKNKRGKFFSPIGIWTEVSWNLEPVCYQWTTLFSCLFKLWPGLCWMDQFKMQVPMSHSNLSVSRFSVSSTDSKMILVSILLVSFFVAEVFSSVGFASKRFDSTCETIPAEIHLSKGNLNFRDIPRWDIRLNWPQLLLYPDLILLR